MTAMLQTQGRLPDELINIDHAGVDNYNDAQASR